MPELILATHQWRFQPDDASRLGGYHLGGQRKVHRDRLGRQRAHLRAAGIAELGRGRQFSLTLPSQLFGFHDVCQFDQPRPFAIGLCDQLLGETTAGEESVVRVPIGGRQHG